MDTRDQGTKQRRLWQNGTSLAGLGLAGCAFVAWTVLLIVDVRRGHSDAHFGLLVYGAIPALFALGGAVTVLGLLGAKWRRRRLLAAGRARLDRKTSVRVLAGGALLAVFMVVSLVAAYRTYHYTESVGFCGLVCHEVMAPQHTTFQDSPHSSMACTECHIGPGVAAFVKAKIAGLQEVYLLAFNKFHRPIAPPVKNLRPARETCRTCHWPEKFFGAVLRTWTYYLPVEDNAPWTIKMLLNIGGGNPRHGAIHGIHWHMEGVNDVEYIATDDQRLQIPWVRAIDQNGIITVYETTDEDERLTAEQIATTAKRRMDCMDCHNRPTHAFLSPNAALDLAMIAGTVDPAIPEIKYTAGELLAGDYESGDEALDAIAAGLRETYEGRPDLETTIEEVQEIYKRNFFPEMKVRWDAYPDHIGHKITPGCFRCHDGQHVSESGDVIRNDCNTCHVILAQGPGTDPDGFTAHGVEYKHPEDIEGEWKTERCDTCHTGSP